MITVDETQQGRIPQISLHITAIRFDELSCRFTHLSRQVDKRQSLLEQRQDVRQLRHDVRRRLLLLHQLLRLLLRAARGAGAGGGGGVLAAEELALAADDAPVLRLHVVELRACSSRVEDEMRVMTLISSVHVFQMFGAPTGSI